MDRAVNIRHWLAHFFGMYTGLVVAEWHTDGYLWVGFQCGTCGGVSGAYRTKKKDPQHG